MPGAMIGACPIATFPITGTCRKEIDFPFEDIDFDCAPSLFVACENMLFVVDRDCMLIVPLKGS